MNTDEQTWVMSTWRQVYDEHKRRTPSCLDSRGGSWAMKGSEYIRLRGTFTDTVTEEFGWSREEVDAAFDRQGWLTRERVAAGVRSGARE